MEDLTGRTVCGYAITGRLGRGGQSAVYRAEDVHLRRTVALKILSEDSLSERTSRKRLLLEARTLSAMNHPNVAKIYRVDEYQGRPLIVMEFIEGLTLSRHVAGKQPPLDARIALMIQIVEAVRYAHGCGVLHRDLKPDNILVTPAGEVKLVDFGLAKLLQGTSLLGTATGERLTETGTVMGTLAYISPEQAQGRALDERSDLFSLGIIFYELLTGQAPFERDTPIHTVVSIIHSPPRPAPPDAGLPDSLKAAVMRLLEKDPAKRFQSADELLARLCGIAGAPVPETAGTLVIRPAGRIRWTLRYRRTLGAVAVLVLLAGLGWLGWRFRPASRSEAVRMLVLPVRSAGDEKSRWMADMATGELVSALGGSLRLKVLYFPGISPERSRELAEQVRREQEVRYILDGEMVRTDAALKITARVLDGSDSSVLWTGTVKGPPDDFYALTGKTASNVASVAGVYVQAETIRFPGREVFDNYTRGLVLVRRRESDKLDEAARLLAGCVEMEPDFVPAYAALAEAYLNYPNLGVSDDPRYLRECEHCLREGLRRDSQDAGLHMMLARLSEYRYDWAAASEQVRRVIELKPSGLDAPYILRATERARLGRIDEALDSYRQARGINPFNPVPFVNQIVLAAMTGNSRAADEAHEGLRQIYAPREFVLIGDAWWTAGRGNLQEASALLERENGRAPHPLLVFSAAEMAFAVGDYRRAAGHLESWLSRNRNSLESYWLLGLCRELLGDPAAAQANARLALQRTRELAGAGRAEPLDAFTDYFAAVAGEVSTAGKSSGTGRPEGDTIARYLRAMARARRGDRSALEDAGTPYDYSYWMNRFSARELELLRERP